MASSALQLLGFFLSLIGVAATVTATIMVEWKMHGHSHRIYEGLWMTCSVGHRTTCEVHDSLLKLSNQVQITRGILLLSVFLSVVALMVSTIGMKCTRFMEGRATAKGAVSRIGGIMFMAAGLMTFVITSWYVKKIVADFHHSHHLHSFEFGKAVFVSWAGGFLTTFGGAFLTCQRCSRSSSSRSINSNRLLQTNKPNSNYV
ncbi:claudin-1-like isoform X1 [Phyllopteryx taeniolatus]|uniref:claudin-1-like isoform X1 n=2 Tax=Phyllopteryx taeniolatus TaxID=161469 RepID=UPI002AD2FA3E|nr:claudin-1-like isoform X1 [Phyllopteryx taeniolatus]